MFDASSRRCSPYRDGQYFDDDADEEHCDEHAANHVQALVRGIWNTKTYIINDIIIN